MNEKDINFTQEEDYFPKYNIYSDNLESINIEPASTGLSNTPVSGRPILRQGDSGPWVAELQRQLTQLTYYTGPINSSFDARTNDAVRAFQRANNLAVDGVVGRNTWSALIFLYAPLAICAGSGHMPVPFRGLVIDPGHGGTDPGAVGNNLIEKDLNLSISMYQKDRFYELNIPVYLTRETDETLTPAERTRRAKNAFGNTPDVICISNHINAGGGEGAEVIYALRNPATFATMILNEIKNAGQVVRRVYQRRSTTNPNLDFYFMIRDTADMQSVIIEYGFIDNIADATRLRYNWKRYAEAVVKAVCEYIGYPYRPPYAEEIIYIVQPGDTLFSISQRFKVSIEDLMSFNDLTSTVLSVGQVLKIPLFTPTPPQQTFTHTVVAGDSLWSLATRFNTTVDEITRLNNLTSTILRIGQQLLIPSPVAPPPPPPVTRPTVRLGDRNEHVRELQRLLTTLGYSPGPIDGIFGNQTLNAIRAFQRDNGLSVDGIVGPITWGALYAASTPQNITYTVVAGDTLFSIARRFNTSSDAIIRLNNLTSTTITVGQQLLIPGSTNITHTVGSGDTLFSIANRFNTTVDEIMRLNNLTSTALSIGQELLIPS